MKEFKNIIGIDVGTGGAIVVYDRQTKNETVYKMPVIEKRGNNGKKFKITDVHCVSELMKVQKPIVFIEKVSSWKGDLEDQGKIFGIEKMLKNYNELLTVIKLANIPYVEVNARNWQQKLCPQSDGKSKSQRKRIYKEFAAAKFPKQKPTLQTADALCITYFGAMKLAIDTEYVLKRIKNYNP